MFLAGRTKAPMEAVAADIRAAGGSVEVAILDATDEQAVEAHVAAVASGSGSVDVSFNLITRGDVQRTPLVDMTTDDLLRAVVTGADRRASSPRAGGGAPDGRAGIGRHPPPQQRLGRRGDARDGQHRPGRRGHGVVHALPAELGPQGVRVLGIHTAGVAETLTQEGLDEVGGTGMPDPETVERMIAGAAMLRRAPRLAQVADVAAFLASDRASGMTATMANVTCGLVPG